MIENVNILKTRMVICSIFGSMVFSCIPFSGGFENKFYCNIVNFLLALIFLLPVIGVFAKNVMEK